jgi:hypothetical protein
MDGIVPIIYIISVLGCVVSLITSAVLGSFLIFSKQSLAREYLTAAKINTILVLAACILVFASVNTIIGYGPLTYVSPALLVLSLVIQHHYKKSEQVANEL